jgi:hypothetical protein
MSLIGFFSPLRRLISENLLPIITLTAILLMTKKKNKTVLEMNNPFSLRGENIPWKGKIGFERGFSVFDSIDSGLRAGYRDIRVKFRNGLDTVRKIITVYAPPSENNTDGYIKFVSDRLNVEPDQTLTFEKHGLDFGKAIVRMEHSQTYPDAQMLKAYNASAF